MTDAPGGRWRLVALAAIVVVALGASSAFVWSARDRQQSTASATPAPSTLTDLKSVSSGPHVVFRNAVQGQGYGRVAVASLTAPDGPRALTPATCDRVYATAKDALCLYARPGMVTSYHGTLLGPDWAQVRELPLSGVPSRARLSRDASLSATTTFVYGHSYSSPGEFSTETRISRTDGSHSDNIESFALTVGNKRITNSDRNIWGVTFADDDRFYATAASGDKTWLVEGSLSARKLTALREDAECPSLSPDRTRVAIKMRDGLPAGQWRIGVLDLATRQVVRVSETRSVDDQVEWLDDGQVLYGLSRQGEGVSSTDIWAAAADGSGSPRLFIPDAWSPAVVR